MTSPDALPNPERHEVAGESGGATYETPLSLGPDSDHAGDPNREDDNGPGGPSSPTSEPALESPSRSGQ